MLTTPRGTCTAAGGLDAETFRGFQFAGELFLLTSFFIEPEGGEFRSGIRLAPQTPEVRGDSPETPRYTARKVQGFGSLVIPISYEFDRAWMRSAAAL